MIPLPDKAKIKKVLALVDSPNQHEALQAFRTVNNILAKSSLSWDRLLNTPSVETSQESYRRGYATAKMDLENHYTKLTKSLIDDCNREIAKRYNEGLVKGKNESYQKGEQAGYDRAKFEIGNMSFFKLVDFWRGKNP